MKINEKIQTLLSEKEISNLELSRLTGVPNSTLADILKGKTNRISVNAVFAIAKVLNVSADYLIDDEISDPYYSKKPSAALFQHGKIITYDDLPEEAQKELESYLQYLRQKYSDRTDG